MERGESGKRKEIHFLFKCKIRDYEILDFFKRNELCKLKGSTKTTYISFNFTFCMPKNILYFLQTNFCTRVDLMVRLF